MNSNISNKVKTDIDGDKDNEIEKHDVDLPELEKDIANKLTDKFDTKIKVIFIKKNRIKVDTNKNNILEIAKFINQNLKFDHVESVSGVDYPDQNEIEVVYHLGSYDPSISNQILALSTRTIRETTPHPGFDRTRLPSLRDIFYSVEFHERECFEMLGVYFENHPDNRRLLLPEDWADLPPLRKDFKIKGR